MRCRYSHPIYRRPEWYPILVQGKYNQVLTKVGEVDVNSNVELISIPRPIPILPRDGKIVDILHEFESHCKINGIEVEYLPIDPRSL